MRQTNFQIVPIDQLPSPDLSSKVQTDQLSKGPNGEILIANPHLLRLKLDILYHLTPLNNERNLEAEFGDVRFVCMGGTEDRMCEFAQLVSEELDLHSKEFAVTLNITKDSHRFSMFKVGPVLSVSHGMGGPSISILLDELIKLVYYAKCKNVEFYRIGTCGGIGLNPGTVVITQEAVDDFLQAYYQSHDGVGNLLRLPTKLDSKLIQDLKATADADQTKHYEAVVGYTISSEEFYETQSRLDGPFCTFTEQQKLDRLQALKNLGIRNFEMEGLVFASKCWRANIPGAIVCVTILDRLEGDQVNATGKVMKEFQSRPQQLVLKLIKKKLAQTNGSCH